MPLTKGNGIQVKPTRNQSRATSPDWTSIDLGKIRMSADGHKLDVRYPRIPWERRREIGKALRERTHVRAMPTKHQEHRSALTLWTYWIRVTEAVKNTSFLCAWDAWQLHHLLFYAVPPV
jgi:hypothetical protein